MLCSPEKNMFQVLVLVALGALAIALFGVVRRYALKDKLLTTSQFVCGSYVAATLAFLTLYSACFGLTLPAHLAPRFFRVVILGAAANVVIQGLNAKAGTYKLGEVSYATPLQSLTPLLITLAAVLVGEFPGPRGILGVLVMTAGAYVLGFEKRPERWYLYLTPFARVLTLFWRKGSTEAERQKSLVTMLSLGSATFGTLGLICDGIMVRRAGDLQGIVLAAMTLTVVLSLAYLPWMLRTTFGKKPETASAANEETKESVKAFALTAFCAFALLWVMHVLLIQPRFNEAFIAYVGTLKRFSVLFAVLAGAFFFREAGIKKRLVAALLIVIGAVLITTDSLPAHLSARLVGLGL
ncbi:MAG: putative rane protein [Parcubacteria group bacterium]|nr:putative rane protein [Parcubacteria group bacterium]